MTAKDKIISSQVSKYDYPVILTRSELAESLNVAMDEYASLKAEEAFNAAREYHGNKGMQSWEYSTFKDYQTFKNQKP